VSDRDIILDELGRHYLGDELRLDATFADAIPSMAAASAARIAEMSRDLASVIGLLRELRADRAHPLLATIGEQTLLWWHEDDAAWRLFGRLIDEIVANLELRA
jgi:hypothetical protein